MKINNRIMDSCIYIIDKDLVYIHIFLEYNTFYLSNSFIYYIKLKNNKNNKN